MPYLMIRHKVKDLAAWKPVYGGHASAREDVGIKEEHAFRNADDSSEIVLLFKTETHEKARRLTASDELRQAMARAGVTDEPDILYLDKL